MSEYPAVDNATMLRALRMVESPDFDQQHPLVDYVLHSPSFNIVRENEFLKGRLVSFLELDYEVAKLQRWFTKLSLADRWAARGLVKTNRQALKELKLKRDHACREYEVFRRLVCFDNLLFRLLPS